MDFKLILCLPLITLTSSCVILDPYIPTTKIEVDTIEVKHPVKLLSQKYRKKFESYASELSQVSNSATVALAGLLGFGGYKGVTGGGGHQIAALGAGAGVTYGLHGALYKPSREQIYLSGVSALNCIDKLYSGFDSGRGEDLAKNYLDDTDWLSYKDRYYAALIMVRKYEDEYKSRVLDVPATINVMLSAEQPSPEQSYAFISSVITSNIPAPKAVVPKVAAALGGATSLYPDLEDWVSQSEQLSTAFKDNPSKECPIAGGLAPRIVKVGDSLITKLNANSVTQFPIQNTSGVIGVSAKPQDATDKNALETKILADKGEFSIEINAKTKTTKPIFITVVDYGKGGASSSMWVEVN
ncbi:hypothetical protein [Pseudomonas sp.]|uniref:hypothetical protein n=1 Tax=Pseudomonas sp. TaxID=306 RepID=UPI003C74B3FF